MDSYNTGAIVGLGLVQFVTGVGLYVWVALSLAALFKKAGEPAWAGWVPFYNDAVVLKLGGFSPWLILLLLVPFLGQLAVYVLLIVAAYRISVAFGFREGSGVGMTVLAALVFPVWSSILGWGSARWVGPDPRLLAAAIGGNPGAGYTPGYHRSPAPDTDGGFAPAPAAFAPPAPPEGYTPPPAPPAAPPAGYVPPAAPEGYTPPPPPAQPAGLFPPAAGPFAPRAAAAEDLEGVDDPVPSAPASPAGATADAAIIDEVPASAAEPAAPADPWAPPPLVTGPRRSPMPEDPADFSDTSAEVSAVAGAPQAGAPKSAWSSVAAQRNEPELPDAEAAFDETIVAPRRRTEWMLTPPLGAPIRLTSPVLILGRRPADDPEYPQAQLIDVADETRTVSKTHARLELVADRWTITDLESTNGVVIIGDDGTEIDLPAGGSHTVVEKFLLGDAELRLTRGQE